MTQQPQEGFDRSVEDAREWMKAVQERLQVNDNTQGPRAALEARLRETEKICQLEPEGRVKVDVVLRAAEALLARCHEDQKPQILARLRDVKAQWEETVTYMTHCHSRIEWVWLHWSEYLLARDEFYRWFQKMTVALEPPVELQLGLKEKQWQLSHAQVLLHNVDNQAVLLDRLLEEAASLLNRIGDPSVDEDAQKRMKAEYDAVKAKAQDRVHLLERVTQEHAHFQASVDEFQLWLKAVVERVSSCVGHKSQLSTKDRLSALQVTPRKPLPEGSAARGQIGATATGLRQSHSNTGSEPLGTQLVSMRIEFNDLALLQAEARGRIKAIADSLHHSSQQRRILNPLSEARDRSRILMEGLEVGFQAISTSPLCLLWSVGPVTRAALAAEEPRVDRLQAQLKKLIAFPQDPQPLSDSVVATIQEFQRLKAKTSRLCNAADVQLWQRLQRPLQDLQLWRALAQRLLDVTASLPDPPSIHTFLPQIEAALAESSRLKEQLTILQLKKDLLGGVFGQERAAVLLEQVATSVRDRDLLHNRLLQRKSKLQSSLAQHKDFGAAFEPLQKKLLDLRIRIQAENGLQRDLPGKQAQLSRLQGLQEEGLDLGAQVEATRSLIQDNPNHQHKMDQLSADYQALHRSLEDLMDRCQQSVREHCTFSHQLLELRHWLAVLTQKLEAHRGYLGPWDAQSREAEAERLLAELPEKEAQLPLIEALGRLVMEKSSPEGAAMVQEELAELAESWGALRLLEESLQSLVRNQQLQRTEVDSGKKMIFTNNIPKTGFLITPTDLISRHHRRGSHPLDRPGEGSHEDFSQLLRNFELWLQVENSKLVRIIAMKAATAEDLRTRETKLQELEARVPEGQHLFENLLRLGPARGSLDELEDLRYRWMLYKSKLKDSSLLLTGSSPGEPTGFQKVRRLPSVCCVALPLQLLLLLLLLLLFLLPVGEEHRSCSLANNFARSFRFMLRYNGPPPT
uniref:Nesprin-3 n=1 Tax=Sus scrofa TaxID=9823 RepID=A0A8D1LUT5_PIG